MAIKSVVPLLVTLALVAACGGEDPAEAKQGSLTPVNPRRAALAATEEADASTPKTVDHSAPAAAKPATAADSSAAGGVAEESQNSLGRESFSYTGGSRDPFVSLLSTAKVGPELPDLLLVAIYYDTRNPGASVVMMREKVGGRKFSLRPGDRLGRLRVSEVRPKDVVFTIDDFGTERQETVSLRKENKQ